MWSKLETLYHIVKAGSLVNAAKVLKTDQPALTHKLKTLEKKFGFKLINRSTPQKPLTLTRKGAEVFKVAEKTFMLVRELNTKLYEESGLKGKVRLSTSHAIASYIITPLLTDFSRESPETKIEILCNDMDLDIINNEVDIAIRPYTEDDDTLVQEHLFTFQVGLYASPAYLEKFGTPETVEDLDNHRLLTFARAENNPYSDVNWALKVGRENKEMRKPFYEANSTEILLRVAEAGLGITPFYKLMEIGKNHKLVPVLKEEKGPAKKFYLTYPKNLKDAEKVKAIKEFLFDKIKNFEKQD